MDHTHKTKEELIKELQEEQQQNHSMKVLFDNEITNRRKAEEALVKHNDVLAKLNQFSIEFGKLSVEDDLETFILKRIRELTGARVAMLSNYHPETRTLTTDHVEMDPGLIKKFFSLVGNSKPKLLVNVNDEMYGIITKEVVGVRKTLYEVSFGTIPRPMSATIQSLLKVDRFIGISFLIEGKLFGTALLGMSKDQPDLQMQILENFSFLASVYLRNKKAEIALKTSRDYLDKIMNAVASPIFVKNDKFQFTLVNDSLCELLGLPAEEIIGKTGHEYLPEEQMKVFIIKDQEVFKTGKENINEEFLTDGKGKIRTIITKKTLYTDDQTGNKFLVGVISDITEIKQAEQEIVLKNKELKKINSEKDKFFSIIAHDLRGPFNGFLGLTKILSEELQNMKMVDIQKFALSMRNSATNLYRLLENLLEWSKMQQGALIINPEQLELSPIVNESIEMILELAKNKDIDINSSIPEDMVGFVDKNIFQTVIRNLVSNAVKFTHKGGKVTITAKTIDSKSIEISINDTGIGMSRTIIDNLFSLNSQLNRKGTEGEPSTGLGLIICKDFIENQNGKIWVESDEKSGSCFYFTIPRGNCS